MMSAEVFKAPAQRCYQWNKLSYAVDSFSVKPYFYSLSSTLCLSLLVTWKSTLRILLCSFICSIFVLPFQAGRRSKQKAWEVDRGTQTHSAADPGGEAEGMRESVFLHHHTKRAMISLCMSPKAHTDSVYHLIVTVILGWLFTRWRR